MKLWTDDGRTNGRTPDHGYTISSPCEPIGSGELKIDILLLTPFLHLFIKVGYEEVYTSRTCFPPAISRPFCGHYSFKARRQVSVLMTLCLVMNCIVLSFLLSGLRF